MAGMKLTAFAGMAPRVASTLLADNEAQKAINTKLYAGDLRPWNKPGSLTPKVSITAIDVQSFFKVISSSGDAMWLSWNKDVDVVKGSINQSSAAFSAYYTGDGFPKKTNAEICNAAGAPSGGVYPNDYLFLGVPSPGAAPAIQINTPSVADPTLKGQIASSVGVGDHFTATMAGATVATTEVVRQSGDDFHRLTAVDTEYRVYVYTYVSLFGDIEEESAPSPVSEMVTVRFGQTVQLKGFVAPPSGKYNFKKIRVYRSVQGTNAASFLFVGEFDITTLLTSKIFDDTTKAEGLGEPCPSFDWSEPPEELRGLCVMANGIYCGFKGREIYFSEPFMPHAWDLGNAVSTEHKVVGMKAFGQSLYVATEGNPYVVSGVAPEQMTSEKLPIFEPCVSKRSIAVDQFGAYYASPNGIVSIGPGGADNITRNLFTMTEWQKYNPKSMLGAAVDGRYYLFYKTDISPVTTGGLVFDKYVSQSPLSEISFYVDALYVEPTESALYVFVDDQIKKWEGDTLNGLAFQWTSKLFVLPRPLCFSALQVEADFADIDVAKLYQEKTTAAALANQALFSAHSNLKGSLNSVPTNTYTANGSLLIDLPPVVDDRYVTIVLYADGVQKAVVNVKNRDMYRLPGGFKADRWEFKIMGNIPVRHVKVAESGRELGEL